MFTAQPPTLRHRPQPRVRAVVRSLVSAIAVVLTVLLGACTNPPAVRPSPSPTRTPTSTISAAHDLLAPGLAEEVVAALVEAAHGRPIVRVVLDRTRARLTYVGDGNRPRSIVWLAGVISPSDDGTDLVSTTKSFDPTRFNLSDVATLFTLAGMISQSTSRQELQINEYDHGQVYMTVTTSPESTTVFFDQNGILIKQLRLNRDADIAHGIDEVLAGRALVLELGFQDDQLWADVLASPGVIERRIRPLQRPMYLSQRRETPSGVPFDIGQVDPATLGRLLRTAPALLGRPASSPVTLQIAQPADASEPQITVTVDGEQLELDLSGAPIEAA